MEEDISLIELITIVKKRLALIIHITLIGLLISAIYTFFIAIPSYNANTQLLVNRVQSTDIQQSDINTNLQLINTYKDIIKGPVILDDVRTQTSIALTHTQLSNKITITNESNSQVFSIRVDDTNPYVAAEIANTTASVFQKKLKNVMNVDNITIISPAVPNMSPVSPNNNLHLIIGFVLGGVIGVSIAFLLEFLDNTAKDEQFITNELVWASLGVISKMNPEDLAGDKQTSIMTPLEESTQIKSRRARLRV